MYPGQRFFALPYMKVHFLSSICSEGIQCWSSCRGFIVLQASVGWPLLTVQATLQHYIIQSLPICIVKMGKAVPLALHIPQRLSCWCDLTMCEYIQIRPLVYISQILFAINLYSLFQRQICRDELLPDQKPSKCKQETGDCAFSAHIFNFKK